MYQSEVKSICGGHQLRTVLGKYSDSNWCNRTKPKIGKDGPPPPPLGRWRWILTFPTSTKQIRNIFNTNTIWIWTQYKIQVITIQNWKIWGESQLFCKSERMKIQGWKGWRCRLIVDRSTQLYLHFDFICYLLCQQTNTKDTAGQSARCREARMKMDPAKSGLLPPLASISPVAKVVGA